MRRALLSCVRLLLLVTSALAAAWRFLMLSNGGSHFPATFHSTRRVISLLPLQAIKRSTVVSGDRARNRFQGDIVAVAKASMPKWDQCNSGWLKEVPAVRTVT